MSILKWLEGNLKGPFYNNGGIHEDQIIEKRQETTWNNIKKKILWSSFVFALIYAVNYLLYIAKNVWDIIKTCTQISYIYIFLNIFKKVLEYFDI